METNLMHQPLFVVCVSDEIASSLLPVGGPDSRENQEGETCAQSTVIAASGKPATLPFGYLLC